MLDRNAAYSVYFSHFLIAPQKSLQDHGFLHKILTDVFHKMFKISSSRLNAAFDYPSLKLHYGLLMLNNFCLFPFAVLCMFFG